jgi:hypothetical protein
MECLAARRRALRFGAKSTRGCDFYVKYDETTIVALSRERRVGKGTARGLPHALDPR